MVLYSDSRMTVSPSLDRTGGQKAATSNNAENESPLQGECIHLKRFNLLCWIHQVCSERELSFGRATTFFIQNVSFTETCLFVENNFQVPFSYLLFNTA